MKTIGSSKVSAPGTSRAIIYLCVGAAILGVLSTGTYLLSERSSAATSATLQTGLLAPSGRDERGIDNGSHAKHLELAMRAYSADKLIAPAGENALEHYLAALQSKPDDFGAQEAILELVPVAMTALETAMAANASEEVGRLIVLLERADPGASRVAALKKRWQESVAQQANLAADAIRSEAVQMPLQAAPVLAARTPEVQEATEVETSTPVTQRAAAVASPMVAATVAPTRTATKPEAPAVPAQNRVVEARALSTARAVFPAQARRQKIEGWVDLQVAIDANGRVTDALVLSAQPSRIFDVEARRAVMRWRYSPKRVNDQPVNSVLRQRIKFSLTS